MGKRQSDIDQTYRAMRPRLPHGGFGGGTVQIPPTPHARDIQSDPYGSIDAENVQAAIEEIADEKLNRDGTQTVTGNLDHDSHTIYNVSKLSLVGLEASALARVDGIKALAFTAVAPTPEIGRLAWDSVEGTLVAFVESGS